MPSQQIAHLVIVGLIALVVLAVFGAILRKLQPRGWWITLLAMALAPILAPVILKLLR